VLEKMIFGKSISLIEILQSKRKYLNSISSTGALEPQLEIQNPSSFSAHLSHFHPNNRKYKPNLYHVSSKIIFILIVEKANNKIKQKKS
jgi:hypothetical protein